jgi:hypothetical protein
MSRTLSVAVVTTPATEVMVLYPIKLSIVNAEDEVVA